MQKETRIHNGEEYTEMTFPQYLKLDLPEQNGIKTVMITKILSATESLAVMTTTRSKQDSVMITYTQTSYQQFMEMMQTQPLCDPDDFAKAYSLIINKIIEEHGRDRE